jgi:uncharacterized phiE125 gp8 family phage protein
MWIDYPTPLYTYWPGSLPPAPRWSVLPPNAPDTEPITAADLYNYARIVGGDEEDPIALDYIRAARQQVENDTGRALPMQTLDIFLDYVPYTVVPLPWPPVIELPTIEVALADGTSQTVTDYSIDFYSQPARLLIHNVADLPALATGFTVLHLTLLVGYSPPTLPPLLKHAVGLLAAHFLTTGRDITIIGDRMEVMPFGYAEAIAPFRLVALT